LSAVLNLAVFAAAIVGPPVVLWYVIRWLGWGLNHRPGIAWIAIVFLVAVLVFAALSFPHFFPNCSVGISRTHCFYKPPASGP
jgi:hypothetical protein